MRRHRPNLGYRFDDYAFEKVFLFYVSSPWRKRLSYIYAQFRAKGDSNFFAAFAAILQNISVRRNFVNFVVKFCKIPSYFIPTGEAVNGHRLVLL